MAAAGTVAGASLWPRPETQRDTERHRETQRAETEGEQKEREQKERTDTHRSGDTSGTAKRCCDRAGDSDETSLSVCLSLSVSLLCPTALCVPPCLPLSRLPCPNVILWSRLPCPWLDTEDAGDGGDLAVLLGDATTRLMVGCRSRNRARSSCSLLSAFWASGCPYAAMHP